jgi:glycosyltransferase involved in cell wall biosynthesis
VYSRRLPPDLDGLVTWRRIPTPEGPFRLQWLVFSTLVTLRLLRQRPDLVQVIAPAPLVHLPVDLVHVYFSQAAFEQVHGNDHGRLPRRFAALLRRIAVAMEVRAYRPGRVRLLAALAPGGEIACRAHYRGTPTTVIPHIVDARRFRPDSRLRADVRRREGVSDQDVICLFLNNQYWSHKGLEPAIAAFAKARAEAGALAQLWVVGSGPVRRFTEIAKRYGVADRVVFKGFRKDVEGLYAAVDILLHPTAYDTFSLAVHEAAASGVAIISTKVDGIEDLIADGQAGMMVERDAGAIAAALVRLAGDAALRAQLGAVARERALLFTAERCVTACTNAYAQLLERA